METEAKKKLFTVDEYHRMAEAGVLGPDEGVELIEGEIIQMSPTGSRHASCVMRVNQGLVRAFGGRAWVSPQLPLGLDDYSEPEPDLALVALRDDVYASGLPAARDAFLVVEISDTTLRFDRNVKVPLYATAGIPEVWIIDLGQDVLHVYRHPSGDEYTSLQTLSRGARVSVAAFPDIVFAVDQFLP